ncbi:MAG: hypothetical protein IK102_03660 [Treponema sp.]|nr:hypothetical protein [Treponema sp.]
MIYIQTRQTVFPKSIYIGDRAEIRCQFTSDVKLPEGPLTAQGFVTAPDYSTVEIKDISLVNSGDNSYSLVINCVPWHTGSIVLPDYQIQLPGVGAELTETYGTIHFEQINVLSLVEQKGVNSLQQFASPLLLPGTVYKIYGGIAAFVIFLVVFIRLIVKRHSVAFWFKTLKLRLRYQKNKKHTVRLLKALKPNRESASMLQKYIREYLEVRLEYPFTKTLTSEMNLAFEKATASLADETRQSAFETIISVFVRTDYIRFSSTGSFKPGELEELVDNLVNAINIIEGGANA